MNVLEIKRRRLEIAVRLGQLAEADCDARKVMLGIETEATTLHTELAQLDLEEASIGVPNERIFRPPVKNGS